MRIEVPARRRRALPLTALVDVCFILLFFFMLASHGADTRHIDLQLAAPAAPAAAATPSPRLWVELHAGGALQLAGAPITPEALLQRLAAEPSLQLVLQPVGAATLQDAVTLLEQARARGSRVALGGPA